MLNPLNQPIFTVTGKCTETKFVHVVVTNFFQTKTNIYYEYAYPPLFITCKQGRHQIEAKPGHHFGLIEPWVQDQYDDE